ncbi:RluA family pseudouridine synthase [Geobacter sulfurreducens]|jgi:RluA family pseudouridine synthase|uniref:RNA pseudouridine synthase, RluA family n=1 Tax=Geobacter sulfurreducens (strain ATCC 51573 / DSM 12127 / PCA) TaxID=243231 RepID=Q74FD8_GEOSL|nr:RluA family pseudouridine synthase [Geobacter sulfurreducens]AAR34001.1 RNA pseudouridine synthase, RluA family [Geobacter sulfurreducens PCA]ADI83509.1 RNA pseudouridine synthase, RluA family [Geobacter sulfurreducens KN400]AJY70418.1 pseudouridine synthase [Geobacter sulfurreducens]QVW35909.1 RluA family pseudouridine synthase [Geobacter sulfurreducens]UAC04734.1 RluA family pseudouridine synthase [Geobacter sulfurreducens]
MLTYQITDIDHCRSAESFLRNLLPAAPSAYIRKLISAGHLKINGGAVAPDTLLAAGNTATIKESDRTRQLLAAAKPQLDILWEDDYCVIVNKPAGLPVHRTAEAGEANLVELAEHFMAGRGTAVKLRPVNRLDRGTSGATILAKSSSSAGMLGRYVKEEGLDKLYLAVTDGSLPDAGTIDTPLDGKDAHTDFRTLARDTAVSFALVIPISGRMHQIRKHLSAIGHPVRGDRRYRGTLLTGYPGHLLHAFRVALIHPVTGRKLIVHAPLPPAFIQYLPTGAPLVWHDLLREIASRPD